MLAIIYARNRGVLTAMLTNDVTKTLLSIHVASIIVSSIMNILASDPTTVMVMRVVLLCTLASTAVTLMTGFMIQRKNERDFALETIYRLQTDTIDV